MVTSGKLSLLKVDEEERERALDHEDTLACMTALYLEETALN